MSWGTIVQNYVIYPKGWCTFHRGKVLYVSEMFKLLNVFKYFELKNLSKVCFILPCMLKEYAEEDFTS